MPESTFYLIVYFWIACGLVIFPAVLRIIAPYGRHTSGKWGKRINNRLGWIIMESPALLVFGGFFLFGPNHQNIVTWIFFLLWMIHYVHRTLIFPFRLRMKEKQMPLAIVFMALGFNLMNGFVNGYYFGNISNYPVSWLTDPRFIGGIVLFFSGMAINLHSDTVLIHLRKPGETGYKIPVTGFFRFISCPNHFGEIIEWAGFALMCWSSPALSFAVWTLVNLMPRALHHHKWYKEQFSDYPPQRKALIPFIL